MIVDVVPIKKIRSGVETLSYLVPENLQAKVKVGARVVIPFRNSRAMGIIWQIQPTQSTKSLNRKLLSILSLIDQEAFLDDKQRNFLTWIAAYYLAPLPSVLSMAIPKFFQKTKESPDLSKLNENGKQVLILAPNFNYPLGTLHQRPTFYPISGKTSEQQKALIWQRLAANDNLILFGIILPLFMPYKKLTKIIIFEPENSLFKYEQTPKIHVYHAACRLAEIHQAKLEINSYSPFLPIKPKSDYQFKFKPFSADLKLVDLSREKRLINFQTETWIHQRLDQQKQIIVWSKFKEQDDFKIQKTFPQTKIVRFNKKANLKDAKIIITTEEILYSNQKIQADLLIPNLDPHLERPDFQPIELYAKINKFSQSASSVLIQTNRIDQPFVQSLIANNPSAYFESYYSAKEKNLSYPFGFWLRLIYTSESEAETFEETEKVSQYLTNNFTDCLKVYGPSPAFIPMVKNKYRYSILLQVKTSIPNELRNYLLKLNKPWNLDPHPVNLL